jgi:hypothetical protein
LELRRRLEGRRVEHPPADGPLGDVADWMMAEFGFEIYGSIYRLRHTESICQAPPAHVERGEEVLRLIDRLNAEYRDYGVALFIGDEPGLTVKSPEDADDYRTRRAAQGGWVGRLDRGLKIAGVLLLPEALLLIQRETELPCVTSRETWDSGLELRIEAWMTARDLLDQVKAMRGWPWGVLDGKVYVVGP